MLSYFLVRTLQCKKMSFFAHENMKELSSKSAYFSLIEEIFSTAIPAQISNSVS